jgi:hypothetical protein
MEDAFSEYENTVGLPDQLVSGCAHGVDTLWMKVAAVRYPNAHLLLIVPAAPCNLDLVHDLRHTDRRRLQVLYMPEAATNSDAYMQRNDQVQHNADVLTAFPSQPKEVMRSGTWSTIRRFRKAGKGVYISPVSPDAEPWWE